MKCSLIVGSYITTLALEIATNAFSNPLDYASNQHGSQNQTNDNHAYTKKRQIVIHLVSDFVPNLYYFFHLLQGNHVSLISNIQIRSYIQTTAASQNKASNHTNSWLEIELRL